MQQPPSLSFLLTPMTKLKTHPTNPIHPPIYPPTKPHQDDDSKEYHKEMSKNVNERMQKSMEELKQKHAAGTNEIDDPDRAPTGAAYREANRIQAERSRAQRSHVAQAERRRAEEVERVKGLREQVRRQMLDKENEENGKSSGGGDGGDGNGNGDGNDSSDDEYDDLLDDDETAEIEAIRAKAAVANTNVSKINIAITPLSPPPPGSEQMTMLSILWPNEKMKRKEAKAISSLLSVHYLSIDLSLRTEIVPGIPVSELG